MKSFNKKIIFITVNLFLLFSQIYAKGNLDEDLSGEYFSIAESYSELKKYDKAIDYFKKAEKSEIYKKPAQYNLAQIYALKEDWENCLNYLEPMYNEVPNNIKIATAYAYALAANGNDKEAINIYKKIYLENPETPEYFLNFIRILIVAKKYDEALQKLNTAKENFNAATEIKIIDELEKKIQTILNPPKEEEEKKEKTDESSKKEKLTLKK